MSSKDLTNPTLANFLDEMPRGRFMSLTIRKSGKTRGRGAAKKLYGDDLVRVTMITGFSYENLVRRSLHVIRRFIDSEFRGLSFPESVTEKSVKEAALELQESFTKSMMGINSSTTDDVYETLEVDGVKVPGARVYIGDGTDTGTQKGDINLAGLIIGEKVLEPAANGPIPAGYSKIKTIAKNILRSKTPIERYRSYTLRNGQEYTIAAGGDVLDAFIEDPGDVKITDDLADVLSEDWSDILED